MAIITGPENNQQKLPIYRNIINVLRLFIILLAGVIAGLLTISIILYIIIGPPHNNYLFLEFLVMLCLIPIQAVLLLLGTMFIRKSLRQNIHLSALQIFIIIFMFTILYELALMGSQMVDKILFKEPNMWFPFMVLPTLVFVLVIFAHHYALRLIYKNK